MARTPQLETLLELHSEFLAHRAERRRLLSAAQASAGRRRYKAAERQYLELVAQGGRNADVWHGLGELRVAEKRWPEALEAFLKAAEIDPSNARHHDAIGRAFAMVPPTPEVFDRYQHAVGCEGCRSLEQLEEACAAAVLDAPTSAACVRLGNVQMARLAFDRAVASYRAALRLAREDPTALQNLGVAFAARNEPARSALFLGLAYAARAEYERAIPAFRRAVADVDEDRAEEAYRALGECYRKLGEDGKAAAVLAEGLRKFPSSASLYLSAVDVFRRQGRTEAGRRLARRGAKACPDNVALKFAAHLMLPVVYADENEIERSRRRYTRGLAALSRDVPLKTADERQRALEAVGSNTNFHLAYQCRDDRSLQVEYGTLVERVMKASYPQWSVARPMPPASGRIRIGYVSAFMRRHAISGTHLGWLRYADRDRFAIHAYHLGELADTVTDEFRACSDVFHHVPDDLDSACARVSADNLHVLVYLDIGMFARATQMGGLRLAPVQCTTYGHTVTTGLPTMDTFISSELMEAVGGEAHYSEQLVRLPHLGVAYKKPTPPLRPKSRGEFGIDGDAVVFLCCQSPFKYLPQYDDVLVSIGQRVPHAQFVFLALPAATILDRRLRRAFDRAGLDGARMCRFVPPQRGPDYLSLMLASDVFLDTFGWSGFNTTLQALGMGLPVVTCPGEFLRGRHAAGCLTRLGVFDTIAADRASYVNTAVRLGLDIDWRRHIARRVAARSDILYEDREAVTALEVFYLRAVNEGSFPPSAAR